MAFFTIQEILYIAILALGIGYIFSGYIQDPSHRYVKKRRFDLKDFRFALLVSAPAIVLHELGHKFVAMAFGLTANFFIFWWGLGLGIFLKLIASPFLILAPGYVLIQGEASNLATFFTSFAGPFVNLLLWVIATIVLATATKLTKRQAIFLYLTKRINMILFIFNMLPIPPLDGSKVFYSLFKILGGNF